MIWIRSMLSIERKMLKIISIPVTDSEKAFSLQPRKENESNATILRNWVTFSLRHFILLEEREAYYINNYHKRSIENFFMKFNSNFQFQVPIPNSNSKLQFHVPVRSSNFKLQFQVPVSSCSNSKFQSQVPLPVPSSNFLITKQLKTQ